MSEYEILDLLNTFHADQTVLLAQLISLHLALIVGIFYFLHRSGMAMKLAIFVLYTLGFAMHIGMLLNLSLLIVGAHHDLAALREAAELSATAQAALEQTSRSFTNWVSIVGNLSLLALWLGTLYFLFFWKRPKDI